ncbi:fluoride efflux transporter FluC [Tenggerimyces flavus]|uniref:Fluoride-specific ion channel FluC n=1 Tax=Tenggerimyces flavus TaxID=1708749 RepID=A0ABV7YBI5_9ACTN|nr:CrcB family protein [Tenggerimyces flavus]MBM7789020.1 CrcB protein [Tenggerimyces flavus]
MRPVGTTVAIAIGGAVGALARYGVAVAIPHADGTFPVATFVTNVVGCLLIGVLMAVVERGRAPDWARPALGVGVLGGFTTFSAYALELTGLLDRPVVALAYLFGTLVAALAATWVGLAGARRLLK